MTVATRGGAQAIWCDDESQRIIFHTDRGSTYTAGAFTKLCRKLGIRQSMGRAGVPCFDNAAAEAFFSSLEWEVLSRNRFDSPRRAQAVVLDWHSTIGTRLSMTPLRRRMHSGRPGGSLAAFAAVSSSTTGTLGRAVPASLTDRSEPPCNTREPNPSSQLVMSQILCTTIH